jgi:hypothetical protein
METCKLGYEPLDMKNAAKMSKQPVPTILQITARLPASIFAQKPLIFLLLHQQRP